MKPFTAREQEVAALLVQGQPYKAIGHLLGMSARTVEVHAAHICRKLGVKNRVQAAVKIATAVHPEE